MCFCTGTVSLGSFWVLRPVFNWGCFRELGMEREKTPKENKWVRVGSVGSRREHALGRLG